MALPFTTEEFFDLFARYNRLLWPAVVVLWLAAAVVLVIALAGPTRKRARPVSLVLAVLWLWGGAVYHAALFTHINPAAWLFAAAFAVEACLFTWYGIARQDLVFGTSSPRRRGLGVVLALYALAYPAVTLWTGHSYPRMPTFGLPCPTTIFTAGLLLTCARTPVVLTFVPVVWGLVGGSAALLLGVTADVALLACAAILVVDAWMA
jgi:hypothetical protein